MRTVPFVALVFSLAVLPTAASAFSFSDVQSRAQEIFSKLRPDISIQQGTSTSVQTQPDFSRRICSMNINRSLFLGSRGDDVRAFQEFLIEEGRLSATATGYFGPMTRSALVSYQASAGISPVGIAGPLTREHIRAKCGYVRSGTFDASPRSGPAPLPVAFTYTPASDEIAQYYIEFGDGQAQVMEIHQIYCIRAPCISPSTASHTYDSPGTYTATVSRYIACLYSNPRCLIAQPPPLASVAITVRGSGTGAPVISGISGPQSLTVNEIGTWKITASDPENEQLSYEIAWGDEWMKSDRAAPLSSPDISIIQEVGLTHSYANPGSYTVRVTVSDTAGNRAQATISVSVSRSVCATVYSPVCGRPPGCANTCPPGQVCTMMCRLYEPQTYSNRCTLNNANAEYLYDGECR